MNDRYIIEREFEHAGCKCVVAFGNIGHRCGYVGIPNTHPLFGKDYNNYLDIKKEDIMDREVSGIIPLMCACLDNDERVRIDVYFQCHGGTTLRAAVELGRSAYGFEIDRTFYQRAKEEMLGFERDNQMNIFDFIGG